MCTKNDEVARRLRRIGADDTRGITTEQLSEALKEMTCRLPWSNWNDLGADDGFDRLLRAIRRVARLGFGDMGHAADRVGGCTCHPAPPPMVRIVVIVIRPMGPATS